jgi:hypothetical protein
MWCLRGTDVLKLVSASAYVSILHHSISYVLRYVVIVLCFVQAEQGGTTDADGEGEGEGEAAAYDDTAAEAEGSGDEGGNVTDGGDGAGTRRAGCFA